MSLSLMGASQQNQDSTVTSAKWEGKTCMLGTRMTMWDSARYPGGDHLLRVHAWCPSVPCSVSSRVSVSLHPRCERQPQGFAFPSFQRCLDQRQKEERANQSIGQTCPRSSTAAGGGRAHSDNLALGLMVGVNATLTCQRGFGF